MRLPHVVLPILFSVYRYRTCALGLQSSVSSDTGRLFSTPLPLK